MNKLFALALAAFLIFPLVCRPQNDPTLALLIEDFSGKAKDQIESQSEVMGTQTAAHVWNEEEFSACADLQRQFNDYISSFHSVVVYAAELYGLCHETDMLLDNLSAFMDQLSDTPSNAVAVMLSASRNDIYQDIVLETVEIVYDIQTVCLSGTKMTESERVNAAFGVRPKIRTLNAMLRRLTLYVRYTTLEDVWRDITGAAYETRGKAEIAGECMTRWKAKFRGG